MMTNKMVVRLFRQPDNTEEHEGRIEMRKASRATIATLVQIGGN